MHSQDHSRLVAKTTYAAYKQTHPSKHVNAGKCKVPEGWGFTRERAILMEALHRVLWYASGPERTVYVTGTERGTETDEETIKACLVTVPRPAVSGLVRAGSRMIPALS